MRLRLRAAGFVALAIVAITCTEASTGPRSSAANGQAQGRVSLAPQFTPAASRAYSALVASGTDITEVHVLLTAADGTTRDTVVAFPVGQDSISIDILVPPSSDGQAFTAVLELRAADHTVLFSGTQVVLAHPSSQPAFGATAVTINYSGPGKSTKTVSIAPPDTTVAGSPTLAYAASGVDTSGKAVTNLLVRWTSSDSSVAIPTSTGNATASVKANGKRGVATISAITPVGITGSSKLTVVPPASKLVVISGGGQTAVAGSVLALPFVVEAQAADNLPVPGTSISFRAVTAGAGVAQVTPRTADATGRASMVLTLGKTGGTYQFEAASGALAPVVVNETATAAPGTAIALVSGDQQVDSTGRSLALPLLVKVTDQFGGPAGGAPVTWTRVSGTGTLGSASTTTANDGTTSTTYTLGTVVGTDLLSASLPGVAGAAGTVQFTVRTIARGAGAITIVSGGGQSAAPNTLLATPLVVKVTDVNGNASPNQPVAFTASLNGATFNPASTVTSAAGLASTVVTLGTAVGGVTVSASSGALSASTTMSIVVGAPASITKAAGDLQTATVGTAVSVAPSVVVKDAGANPIPGATVVFAVASGGGSATVLSATTNASGIATVGSWTMGTVAGVNTLSATTGALTATFSATGVAANGSVLAFTTQPSATAASGVALAAQPIIQLKDALGNPVQTAGVVVTASISNGAGSLANATATTASGGVATFGGFAINGTAGTFSLVFNAPGYAPLASGAIALGAGSAVKLGFVTPWTPGAQGASLGFTPQPGLQLLDASNNAVAAAGVVVTAAVASGPSAPVPTLAGTTATTAANGQASFSGLALGGLAGMYTLSFTASAVTPVVSGTVVVSSGTAAAVAISAGNNQTATVRSATAVAPAVIVTDAFGNPVAAQAVTFQAVTAGSQVSNGATTGASVVVTTNGSGVAALTAWTLGSTAQAYSMTATAAALTPVTFTATAIAGNGTVLAFIISPLATATNGAVLPAQPVFQLRDAQGNNVSTSGVVVTASVASGTGALANATASTIGGVATFSGLTLTGAVGSFTLGFSSPGFTSVTSGAISLVAGSGTTLSLTAGNGQTATVGTPVAVAPSVTVTDISGNPVAGSVVTFGVVTAGASITNTATTSATSLQVTTNASGVATLNAWTLGTVAQSYALTASAAVPNGSPVTFTAGAVAGSGTQLGFALVPPASATSGQAFVAQPVLQLMDAFGNNASTSGIVITAAIASGSGGSLAGTTATTNASGTATFSGLTLTGSAGAFKLRFSAAPYTALTSGSIALAAGAATKLGFGTTWSPAAQPVLAGFSPQPTIQLLDVSGNPVATSGVLIQVTVAAGPNSPTPTLVNVSATTNGTGLATFSGFALGGAVGTYNFSFNATGLTSVVSGAMAVTSGVASSVTVSAGNGQTATAGATVAVAPAALVLDSFGNPVQNQSVTFTAVTAGGQVSNGATTGSTVTVTTNALGVATLTSWRLGNTVQSYSVTATVGVLPAATFTATAAAGAATAIAMNAGNAQSATVNTAVATVPSVRVTDVNGNPVAGIVVTFSAVTAGSQLSNGATIGASVSVTTNASGVAALSSWTLGTTAQSYAMNATATGLAGSPVAFTATATAGAGTTLAFLTNPSSSATNGAALAQQPVFQLKDTFGNNVSQSGVVITAAITSGTGVLTNANATSTGSGTATFSGLTITGSTGSTFSLQFSASGYSTASFGPITLGPGAATAIALSAGNSQTTAVGTAVSIAPAVFVTDASGNPVSGAVVTFTAVTAGSSVANASTSGSFVTVATNASGIAALASWTLGTTAQVYSMNASAGGLSGSPVAFTASATAGAATGLIVANSLSVTATNGVALATQPVIQITDANFNAVAVPGVTVTAAIFSGTGSVAGNVTALTNTSGAATFSGLIVNGLVGTVQLQFTASGYVTAVSSNITLSAGAASIITLNGGNNQSAAVTFNVAIAPSVKVTDAGGNPKLGVTVNFTAVTSGGIIQNSSTTAGFNTPLPVQTSVLGIAALTNAYVGTTPGTYSFTASTSPALSGSPVTFTETGVAGPASKLLLVTPPSSTALSGVAITTQPSVQLSDAAGNAVFTASVVISVTSTNSSGTLTNTTASTNSSGVATFSGLTISGTTGSYPLTFNASGLTGVSAGTTLSAGPASTLAFTTNPSSSATNSVVLATQPAVQLRDAAGNAVNSSGVVVTTTVNSGSGTVTAGASATTNSSGVATFSGLTITGLVGVYTLNFTVTSPSGVATLQSGNITVSAGAASTISVNAGGNQSATVSTLVPTLPSAIVKDISGNPVSGTVVTFNTVTAGQQIWNSSTCCNTLTVITNSAGIAQLSYWSVGSSPQTDTLTATATGLTGSPVRFFAAVASNVGPGLTTTFTSTSVTSGMVWGTQPVVRLLTGQGSPVVGAPVTAFITLEGLANQNVTLGGTITVNTDPSGSATFTNLTLTGASGASAKLHFASTSYGSPVASIIVSIP